MRSFHRVFVLARYAWAAPCTAVGLILAMGLLIVGGTARIHSGVIEVVRYGVARHSRLLPGAITFGHVVLGRDWPVMQQVRAHERVHVAQYERWGVVFFLAYPLSSLVQWLRGQPVYWSNAFEVQARARSQASAAESPPPARH